MGRYCVDAERLVETIGGILKRCPDVERALTRLTIGRGGPRDLAAVGDGLAAAVELRSVLEAAAKEEPERAPEGIYSAGEDLDHHDQIIGHLRRALAEELSLHPRDGGFIARDYSTELDEFRALRDESRRLIASLLSRYTNETSIQNLKIKHNNVLGYFIEVPVKQADKIPLDDASPFIHQIGRAHV